MKAVYLQKPYEISIKEIPEPVRKEGQVKVKIESVGVCGSDIAAYKGESALCTYPRVIGHELIGTIVESSRNARGLKVGDCVVLEPYIFCGKCFPCSIHRTNCCEDLKVLGVHVNGGMCEYFCHPLQLTYAVPRTFPKEELSLIEPLTISLHCIHRLNVAKGEHVVILGAGIIGNLAAQVVKTIGAIPILVDLVDERLEKARLVGIEYTVNSLKENLIPKLKEITSGRMAECVIEATGSLPAIRSALDIASYTGRIALVGWPNQEAILPTGLITKKELDVIGSRTSTGEIPLAIDLITGGKVKVGQLISKMDSLEMLAEGIKLLANNRAEYLKVVGVL